MGGLPGFKELADQDLQEVFFNEGEFAYPHNINSKDMLIVLDDDKLVKRKRGLANDYAGGVYEGDLLFYVREDVYGGKRPDIGEHMRYDGVTYRVTDAQGDTGMYTIVIAKNTARR